MLFYAFYEIVSGELGNNISIFAMPIKNTECTIVIFQCQNQQSSDNPGLVYLGLLQLYPLIVLDA